MLRDAREDSAPQLLWHSAGQSPHKYHEEPYGGRCATCGAISENGVSTGAINNPTFSNHAEFFRYGTHVCRACAWLYGIGKGRPGNALALGGCYVRPVISEKSANEERPAWLSVLQRASKLDPSTPVAGVLTTDTKPRVWPRMRVASVGAFGLYVHGPEYATSVFRRLELAILLQAADLIEEALALGFPKARVYSGLLSDFGRAKKIGFEEAMRLENALKKIRCTPEFVPALIVSRKPDLKEIARGDTGEPESAGAAGGEAHKDGDRLF